jgi:4-amino-4-deoxy-L-arabinose transferase-like glycosyltransferase
VTRQWTAPFRFLHPVVILAFCVTALPWYVLCALRNPDFLHVFIWEHNFERYTTPVFEHRQPFWFFGYILLLAVLPWIFVLLGALLGTAIDARNKAPIQPAGIFFTCWAVFPILFFSFSQSKLPSYILPAVPPIFVLLGRWVSEAIVIHKKGIARSLGWTAATLLLFLIVPLGAAGEIFVGFVILAFGIAILVLAFKKREAPAFLVLSLMVPSVLVLSNLLILPELDIQISARDSVKALKTKGVSAENLSVHRVPRVPEYGLDYYFNRRIPEWEPGHNAPEWIVGEITSPTPIAMGYKTEEAPWSLTENTPASRFVNPTFLFLELYRKK